MSIRDYAAAALTTAAFAEHTSITLEDDPVPVFNARTPLPSTPDTLARYLPACHSHSGIAPRLQKILRHRPLLSARSNGSPDIASPGPHRQAPGITPSPKTTSTIASPGSHGLKPSNSRTATKRIETTAPHARTPHCNKPTFVVTGDAPHTSLGGGQPLSIPSTARPHARIYKETSLHKHKNVFAPTTVVTPGPDLPLIICIEDWARLLQTHNHRDFAKIANLHGNNTCPPVIDSSAAALVTPDTIQH